MLDVATGQVLLDRDAATARIPASVAKLATAAAVLSAYDPGHRVHDPGRRRCRRAGGTAWCSSAPATRPSPAAAPGRGDLPQRASLADLADQVAAALPARPRSPAR